jgi:hypothetical protein
MKVVVLNDCAHVMEDLIPHLLNEFDIEFIPRSRSLWSKTFGILWKILRSQGDIFHVSYSLQDAYLANKLKHLDILHVHGSDVRWTLHSKKYGWIVKSNMKHAKKVLYATPDLEETVKKFRQDAVYLPTPVNIDMFTPKSHYSKSPKAVYFKLHYEEFPTKLRKVLAENNIPLTIMEKNVPYRKMPETLRRFDIFIDRFTIPSFSKTCLEAMSCGLATIDYRHVENFEERVTFLLRNGVEECTKENQSILEKHDVRNVATQLADFWRTF